MITGQAIAVFGGQIKLGVGYNDETKSSFVSMSQLVEEHTVGGAIKKDAKTYGEQIILVFNNLESIKVLRDALDIVEVAIKENGIPKDLPHGYENEETEN